MRFGFEQRWVAAAQDVVEVYLDPDFWSGLTALSATSAPTVLDLQREPDRALVRLQYSLAVGLPREAARFIDTGEVTWIEETTWDLARRSAEVRFLPAQGGGLLRAGATAAMAEDADGTVRRIHGELKVRIPLVGARVERAIVEGVGEHLEAEADAVAGHLG